MSDINPQKLKETFGSKSENEDSNFRVILRKQLAEIEKILVNISETLKKVFNINEKKETKNKNKETENKIEETNTNQFPQEIEKPEPKNQENNIFDFIKNLFGKFSETIINTVENIIAPVVEVLGGILELIGPIGLVLGVGDLASVVGKSISGFGDQIRGLDKNMQPGWLKNIADLGLNVLGSSADLSSATLQTIGMPFKGIYNYVSSGFDWNKSLEKSAEDDADIRNQWGKVGTTLGIPNLPIPSLYPKTSKHASGAMIGEAGPEAVVNLNSSKGQKMFGSSSNFSVDDIENTYYSSLGGSILAVTKDFVDGMGPIGSVISPPIQNDIADLGRKFNIPVTATKVNIGGSSLRSDPNAGKKGEQYLKDLIKGTIDILTSDKTNKTTPTSSVPSGGGSNSVNSTISQTSSDITSSTNNVNYGNSFNTNNITKKDIVDISNGFGGINVMGNSDSNQSNSISDGFEKIKNNMGNIFMPPAYAHDTPAAENSSSNLNFSNLTSIKFSSSPFFNTSSTPSSSSSNQSNQSNNNSSSGGSSILAKIAAVAPSVLDENQQKGGHCVANVQKILERAGQSYPVADGPNYAKSFAIKLMKKGWGSIGGSPVKLTDENNTYQVNAMSYSEWKTNVKSGNIPTGSIVISTNTDWNSDVATGHDAAIALDGGKSLWNGVKDWAEPNKDGVGSIYGDTKSYIVLTPGGSKLSSINNNQKFENTSINNSSSTTNNSQTTKSSNPFDIIDNATNNILKNLTLMAYSFFGKPIDKNTYDDIMSGKIGIESIVSSTSSTSSTVKPNSKPQTTSVAIPNSNNPFKKTIPNTPVGNSISSSGSSGIPKSNPSLTANSFLTGYDYDIYFNGTTAGLFMLNPWV